MAKKTKKKITVKARRVKKTKSTYTAKDIFVLKGLEPVRKRPAMYIGSTGPEGLHHLIKEIIGNSIDEAIMGYCDDIKIWLLPNNRVKVEDNGRGIPVDRHALTKKSALETIMTTLHAGGKFGGKAYVTSGGLHGVGISVVCALSKYMKVEVCRDGYRYSQEYTRGKKKTAVRKVGKSRATGTIIIFEPDEQIFNTLKFNEKKILNYLRQQAYLTKGVKITFFDQRVKPHKTYAVYFEGGIISYIKYLTRISPPVNQTIFYCSGEKNGILVESAFRYTDELECVEETFANNVHTQEGGTHLTGFRSALTRTFNDYAKKNGFLKETDSNFTGEDTREGLTAVISVKIKDPQFEGQTKSKLGNSEAKPIVEQVVSVALADFLERNPNDARAIILKFALAQKARKAAKAAKDTILRKRLLEGLSLPGKLADCASRNPEESELFIVEGESAGGCFSGETKIALTDGRNITFKELIKEDKEGKKNYCYTIKECGSIGVGLIKHPRKTKSNVNVVKVILDNEKEIICTPGHLFLLKNGSYKKAKDLNSKDSLIPLYRRYSNIKQKDKINGYEMVYEHTRQKWVYTHALSSKYNVVNGEYAEQRKLDVIHHKDFNKLNNNPDNLISIDKQEHLMLHARIVKETMARPEVQEKIRKAHQRKEYRERISAIMSTPEMKKMLSERAKKQWENEEYKRYMVQKFLEFYNNNKEYREQNNRRLNEHQKKYWKDEENRKKRSEMTKVYFQKHPEARIRLSKIAKKQWQNEELLKWRSQKTKEQWTPGFRVKRKKSYNKTYLEKSLALMKEIFDKYEDINQEEYNKERLRRNDKCLLRYDTISQRFFQDNDKKLKEAVLNYNHRIKEVVNVKRKIDVYDLEVGDTHNFALSSSVFVHNSSRQARDRHFQAILPLRGKILNVERARLDKILNSKEIKSLIIALGTAVSDDFDIEKARYHRIVIMCDADSDGNHIKTLLLTLFYRYFKPLIERGYLYLAQPPLYKIKTGKKIDYAYTESQSKDIIKSLGKNTNISIQRYKGLGEMNAVELWDTTMDPDNRTLLQVVIEDAREADRIFDILMGKEVLPRKKFIQSYAKEVKNLDV